MLTILIFTFAVKNKDIFQSVCLSETISVNLIEASHLPATSPYIARDYFKLLGI